MPVVGKTPAAGRFIYSWPHALRDGLRSDAEAQMLGDFEEETMTQHEWLQYRRSTVMDMRPYVPGEDMSKIEVNPIDAAHGSPKQGDMIARDPNDEEKGWLVSEHYFAHNFVRV